MSRAKDVEAPPESDRFLEAPHPRETQALFGHARAETQILEAYRAGRLPQAWIIGGREGIGKATLAWRFARFILVNPDPAAPLVQQATDLSVSADHPAAKRVTRREGDVECDEILFDRLRTLRRKLADERGVPAYIVFGDTTLRAMARSYPDRIERMDGIPGMGEKKRAEFGQIFADEILIYLQTNSRQAFD
jgi:ATP-dependent DNA helicase RecQ